MAKCSLCNARKGKRKCFVTGSYICSLCCGQFRDIDKCGGCSFYKEPERNKDYKKAPHYSLPRMADDIELQEKSNTIESAICQFDQEQDCGIDDRIVSRITELLLDKYYFQEAELLFENQCEKDGFLLVDQAIRDDLNNISSEDLVKVIGTIYRSIKRHSGGRREYINFIRQHVGVRIGKQARIIDYNYQI